MIFYSCVHLRQIKEERNEWTKLNDKDTFIYTIIHTIFKIFESDTTSVDVKDSWVPIFSAANYLLEKNVRDPYKILASTNKYRGRVGFVADS